MKPLILLCAVAAASLTSISKVSRPVSDATTGSITGVFRWEGERPKPKPDLVIKPEESKGCKHGEAGQDVKDHSLLIGPKGGVANVVVTLAVKGVEPKAQSEPIELDQHGCRFDPHVVVLPVGSTLRFANSDETNHNVHSFSKKNQQVNKNIAGGTHYDLELDKAEVFEIKCDIHSWMKSYVFVTDDAHWAITDENGGFEIDGVPPGTYKLSWWHEGLGKGKTAEVTVEAGKTATIEQGVSAKKKGSGGRRRRR